MLRNIFLVSASLAMLGPLGGAIAQDNTAAAPMEMTLHGEVKGAGRAFITHGPILGRFGTDTMTVWARTNKPLAAEDSFRVYYGTDPDRLDQVTDPVATRLEDDNTGLITLTGLQPDTRYYYAVGFGDVVHQPEHRGAFVTVPDPADVANAAYNPEGKFNFSFAAMGCARMVPYSSAGLAPQRVMMENHGDTILFAMHAGDYVYEEGRYTQIEQWLWKMGLHIAEIDLPNVVEVAPSIVGAWENYKIYLAKNNYLSELHRHVPHVYTFDDHEILNNVYGSSTPGLVSRRAVWRDIGLQAWDDYLAWANPVEDKLETMFGTARLRRGSDILTDREADFTGLDLARQNILHIHWSQPDDGDVDRQAWLRGPGDANSMVYEIIEVIDEHRLRLSHPAKTTTSDSSYSIAGEKWSRFKVSNVEFFLLDTRGVRDVPGKTFDMSQPKSMLGERQKTWLMESMAESDAEMFVLLSSVNLTIPHAGSDNEVGPDEDPSADENRSDEAWTGFMTEREELIDFWDGLDQPVVMFNADLHNAFSAQVTDNVWEFTASPINADNQHKLHQEGNRPVNGKFQSGPREVDIRWSTFSTPETPRENLRQPVYTVVSVNNVFNNPRVGSEPFWVAYEHPQLVVQFYSAIDGSLLYAESVVAGLPRKQE